jgi:hypothetical protein
MSMLNALVLSYISTAFATILYYSGCSNDLAIPQSPSGELIHCQRNFAVTVTVFEPVNVVNDEPEET